MSQPKREASTDRGDAPLSAKGYLTQNEIELIELYQRQDSLSTQLWQQFILANIGTIAAVVLIARVYKNEVWEPPLLDFALRLDYSLSAAVALIWITYTYGNASALGNSQTILMRIGRQIEKDFADKISLFTDSTKSGAKVKLFHAVVDLGIALLCGLMLFYA